MRRIALFIVMKLIGWFDLEPEILDLLSPKPVPVPEPVSVTITYDSRGVTPEREVKKILKKEIKKELPKKPLLKKKKKAR